MNVFADERIPWGDFFHPGILPVVIAQDSSGWHITAFPSFSELLAQQLEAVLAEKMSRRMLRVLAFKKMTILIIYYQQNYPIEKQKLISFQKSKAEDFA